MSWGVGEGREKQASDMGRRGKVEWEEGGGVMWGGGGGAGGGNEQVG